MDSPHTARPGLFLCQHTSRGGLTKSPRKEQFRIHANILQNQACRIPQFIQILITQAKTLRGQSKQLRNKELQRLDTHLQFCNFTPQIIATHGPRNKHQPQGSIA